VRFIVLAMVASLALVSCEHWTPEDLDHISHVCRRTIETGDFHPSPSPRLAWATVPKPAGTPVVVYGASWCSACRIAEDYMRQRAIPYRVVDVDDSRMESERVATLQAAGLRVSSALPVMDMRGTVTVGFMPCVLEKVWAEP
jgi:glutaredoxin